jgi:cytidine deaminase
MADTNREALVDMARHAAGRAYAKYSGFRVGAALLCDDGSVVTGFNIENRSYGLTVCAERAALFAALAAGKHGFKEIAVAGLETEEPLPPCGACRQVLTEFMDPGCLVHMSCKTGETKTVRLGELLPMDSLHDLSPV